jgi:adenylate cyclase
MSYLDYFPSVMDERAAVAYAVAVGLNAIGLAIVMIVAELRSPSARALAAAFLGFGGHHLVATPFSYLYPAVDEIPRWTAVFDLLIIWGITSWFFLVARTAQPTRRALAWIKGGCAMLALAGLALGLLGWLFPAERLHEFYFCLERTGCRTRGFWIFGWTFILIAALSIGGFVVLLTQRIDQAERIRVVAAAVAVPILVTSAIMPRGYALLANQVALLIFLLALVRYYVVQGERGAFMSRFLSPEVTRAVRLRGIDHAVQPQSLELTAVCCDLRGFTRLAQLMASEQVIRLLNEYYTEIGEAVAAFGGTIKDYAGDGVLILVGAPLPVDDHAQRGIALARRIRKIGQVFVTHWAGPGLTLGMGVGVASGRVTVGAVGGISAHMEYTAVGPAVNLASRLCALAEPGELLIDEHTVELSGDADVEHRGPVPIKGMGEVAHFACT